MTVSGKCALFLVPSAGYHDRPTLRGASTRSKVRAMLEACQGGQHANRPGGTSHRRRVGIKDCIFGRTCLTLWLRSPRFTRIPLADMAVGLCMHLLLVRFVDCWAFHADPPCALFASNLSLRACHDGTLKSRYSFAVACFGGVASLCPSVPL